MPTQNPVPGKPGAIPDAFLQSKVRYTRDGRAKRCYSITNAHWSDEAEEAFLDALACSANVSWSAKSVGASHGTVYRQRRLSAEFAEKWDAALDQAYARLEFELVRVASDSLETLEFDADRPIPRMTVDQVIRVLTLYRSARATGKINGYTAKPRDLDELRESIMKKVRAIRNAPKAN